jgi:hypothetical protein
MARNIFGYKKASKDRFIRRKYDESDIRWLYVKSTLFLIFSGLFLWFIILGKTI